MDGLISKFLIFRAAGVCGLSPWPRRLKKSSPYDLLDMVLIFLLCRRCLYSKIPMFILCLALLFFFLKAAGNTGPSFKGEERHPRPTAGGLPSPSQATYRTPTARSQVRNRDRSLVGSSQTGSLAWSANTATRPSFGPSPTKKSANYSSPAPSTKFLAVLLCYCPLPLCFALPVPFSPPTPALVPSSIFQHAPFLRSTTRNSRGAGRGRTELRGSAAGVVCAHGRWRRRRRARACVAAAAAAAPALALPCWERSRDRRWRSLTIRPPAVVTPSSLPVHEGRCYAAAAAASALGPALRLHGPEPPAAAAAACAR